MTTTDTPRLTDMPSDAMPQNGQSSYSALAVLAAGFMVALLVVTVTDLDAATERVTNMRFAGAVLAAVVAAVSGSIHSYRVRRNRV